MTDSKVITNMRSLNPLGFRKAAQVQEVGPLAVMWNEEGGIAATGKNHSFILALAAGAQPSASVGPGLPEAFLPPPPPVAAEAPPMTILSPASPALTMPAPGDTPRDWLERQHPPTELRDWVLTEGLASKAGAEWASFAKAVGWEIVVTEPASPEQPTAPVEEVKP